MRYLWLYAIVLAVVIGGFLWLAEGVRAGDTLVEKIQEATKSVEALTEELTRNLDDTNAKLRAASKAIARLDARMQKLAAAECITDPVMRTRLTAQKPGATFAGMDGAELVIFLRAFNADPPVTSIKADHILIVRHKRVVTTLVVFFMSGCVIGHDQIPPAPMKRLMEIVAGSREGSI